MLQSLLVKLFFKALLFLFIIFFFLKLIHSFSLTHTDTHKHTTMNKLRGKVSHLVPCSCKFLQEHSMSAAALETESRFSGAQIFLLHSGERHGQRGLLSCHAREESEEDEGCHRQPHRACSLCLGKWNLFVLSTCTPVVCSCQIRLSNQEASGRRRL